MFRIKCKQWQAFHHPEMIEEDLRNRADTNPHAVKYNLIKNTRRRTCVSQFGYF